ncbi:uncharacterized protein EKO05_0001800 [Ascochyta rabiei]|uniref:uncharacterized protein n=1 Tax=Didymella rabiei TaxID=5454 RepID=UPI0018FF531F|nr:uncharacterized protein EKO05_0001800 [Ascochyta rabiei]UPX11178.1 hypothetical protein EKO05_0001800 [Ascochyta rabiei]
MATPNVVAAQGHPLRTGSNSPLRLDVQHNCNFTKKLHAALRDLSQRMTAQRQTDDVDADNSPSGRTPPEERNKGHNDGKVDIGDFERMNLATTAAPATMHTQDSSSRAVMTTTSVPPPTPTTQSLLEQAPCETALRKASSVTKTESIAAISKAQMDTKH